MSAFMSDDRRREAQYRIAFENGARWAFRRAAKMVRDVSWQHDPCLKLERRLARLAGEQHTYEERKMKATSYEHRVNDCLSVKVTPNGHAEADGDAWEWKLLWEPDPESPLTAANKIPPAGRELAWGLAADPEEACARALDWTRTHVLCEGDEG